MRRLDRDQLRDEHHKGTAPLTLARGAVLKDQDVAVCQHVCIVLLSENVVAQVPQDLARSLLDDGHNRDVPETHQHAVSVQRRDRVAVAPFVAGIAKLDDVPLWVEMLGRVPFPDALTSGIVLQTLFVAPR